jgi:hypothetical protein
LDDLNMKPLRIGVLFMAVAFSLLLLVPGAFAQNEPLMPHLFYGQAYTREVPASAGTMVEAWCPGIQNGTAGNPVFVGDNGQFGGPGSFDEKLIVSGAITVDTPVFFSVGGTRALCRQTGSGSAYAESYPFRPSEQTDIDLLVEDQPGSVMGSSGTTSVTASVTTVATSGSTGTGGAGGGGSGGSSSAVSSSIGSMANPTATSAVIMPTAIGGDSGTATTQSEEKGKNETVTFPTGSPSSQTQPEDTPKKAGNEPIFFCTFFMLGIILLLSMRRNT